MAIMQLPEAMRARVVWQYQHPSYSTTWQDMTEPMSEHLEQLYHQHLQGRVPGSVPYDAQVVLPDMTSLYFDFENMTQSSETNQVTRTVRRMMRMG